MPSAPDVRHAVPSLETYRHLRVAAGLSDKSPAAAARGLAHSLFAVQLYIDGTAVAMGRVVGDGGCFFQVVDIAVLPAWQGRGLGRQVMGEIVDWLHANVPPGGYVSLIADGEARRLYAGFDFVPTAPRSIGMAWAPPATDAR